MLTTAEVRTTVDLSELQSRNPGGVALLMGELGLTAPSITRHSLESLINRIRTEENDYQAELLEDVFQCIRWSSADFEAVVLTTSEQDENLGLRLLRMCPSLPGNCSRLLVRTLLQKLIRPIMDTFEMNCEVYRLLFAQGTGLRTVILEESLAEFERGLQRPVDVAVDSGSGFFKILNPLLPLFYSMVRCTQPNGALRLFSLPILLNDTFLATFIPSLTHDADSELIRWVIALWRGDALATLCVSTFILERRWEAAWIPWVIALLHRDDPALLLHTLGLASLCPQPPTELLVAVERSLVNPNEEIRAKSAHVLWEYRLASPAAIPALVNLINDPSDLVWTCASLALGTVCQTPDAIAVLISAVDRLPLPTGDDTVAARLSQLNIMLAPFQMS